MSIDATIATWKLTKKQVTPTQKLILLSYSDRANEISECWPSNKRLELDTGFDRHTICENKQILINKKLISYTGKKKGKTKSIDVVRLNYVIPREGYVDELHEISSVESNTALNLSSVEMPIAKQCGNAHTEPKSLEPKRKDLKDLVDSKKSTITSSSTSQAKDYLQDVRFMSFYSIYPRREKPRDAWKAFKSLKIHDALLERIIADVKERTEHHTPWSDKQYIPLPASYLRSGAYDGEIFNEQEEVRKKVEAAKLETKKRELEQEAFTQKQEREVREKQEQYNQDGAAFRNIAARALTKSGSDALMKVREKLGMRGS